MAKAINLKNGNVIEFTDAQLGQMKSMYLSGMNTHQVAAKFGICNNSVIGRLKAMGVELRPKKGILKAGRDIAEKAIQMRRDGVKWLDIAKATSCGVRTLQYAVDGYIKQTGERP